MSRALAATACLVCGRPEPLGMTVCPACGGAREEVADQLLFVLPSRARSKREMVRERLAALTGQPSRSEAVQSVSLGLRALARVPAASAPEIVARLEDDGIMVTATRADRAWAAIPVSFTFLLAAGAAAGLLAGLQGVWPSARAHAPVRDAGGLVRDARHRNAGILRTQATARFHLRWCARSRTCRPARRARSWLS